MAGGNERGGEREKGKTEGILSFFLGCSEEYEFQGLVLCRRGSCPQLLSRVSSSGEIYTSLPLVPQQICFPGPGGGSYRGQAG